MQIAGVGNTGMDYSRLSTRQAEQQEAQQESVEAVAKAAESVQAGSRSAGPDSQSSAESFGAAQAAAHTAASQPQQASQAPAYTAGTDSGSTTLTNKARSGAELTQSEMSQLKELDSALYSQALKAQKARAEAREQMRARPSSSARIAGEAIARAGNGEDAGSAARAVMDEYRSFAAKYDQADFSSAISR